MCSYFSRGTWPNRCEQYLFMVIALGSLPSKTWIFPDRSPLVRSLKLVLARSHIALEILPWWIITSGCLCPVMALNILLNICSALHLINT